MSKKNKSQGTQDVGAENTGEEATGAENTGTTETAGTTGATESAAPVTTGKKRGRKPGSMSAEDKESMQAGRVAAKAERDEVLAALNSEQALNPKTWAKLPEKQISAIVVVANEAAKSAKVAKVDALRAELAKLEGETKTAAPAPEAPAAAPAPEAPAAAPAPADGAQG
jgi:hypothetical protein